MAEAKTGPDALGMYLTNATQGAATCDPDDSLGGYRASTEVMPAFPLITNDIPEIVVDKVMGDNGNGIAAFGHIRATGASAVAFKYNGGTEGAAVTIADGESKLLLEDSGDGDDKGVRITRDGTGNLANRGHQNMKVESRLAFNGLLGMKDVTEAQRVAGVITYRATILYAHGTENLTNVQVWRDTLGNGNWEIAEEALVSSAIQTIASETTAPTGLTWNTGTTAGTGIQVGAMNAGDAIGLWFKRDISAGSAGDPLVTPIYKISWDIGGTTYTQTYYGACRIIQSGLDRYELYVGEDADPDLTAAADATSATLPMSHTVTPGGANKEIRFTVLKSNQYALKSLNEYWRTFTIDSSGDEVRSTPFEPEIISIAETQGGSIEIAARYSPDADRFPADNFAIYIRGDGTDPTFSSDERTLVEMDTRDGHNPDAFILNRTIGPYAVGADVRVVVRSHRSADAVESANTTATANVIATTTPKRPSPARLFGYGSLVLDHPTFTSVTTVIDAGDSVQWEQYEGYTDFTIGGTVIARFRYDSGDDTNNGLWTTYSARNNAGGASDAGWGLDGGEYPTSWEAITFPVTDDRAYIHVGNAARALIIQLDGWGSGAASMTIMQGAISQDASTVNEISGTDPVEDGGGWHSCIQVFDSCTQDYVTVASLDSDGLLALRVPWRQVATVGEIP